MTRALTRALPRAALHRSRLLRFLHDNALLHDTTPEGKVGEKLGDWLDFRQAIALHGVLYPEAGQAPLMPRRAGSMSAAALTEQFQATRAALEAAVTHSARPAPGLLSIALPVADLAPPAEAGKAPKPNVVFEPYRRYYGAHQRQMEKAVNRLRSQARAALTQGSPALQQLAVLDSSMDGILKEREARLLGSVLTMLEKRFAQLFKQHLKALADAEGATPDPTDPIDPNGATWQAAFGQTLQAALLAELDLRLQPVLGLVEALAADSATPE